MSNRIDDKVVEMRFDNKQFEQNVKQSMSTLDKLKQTLSFKGASKGIEEVGKASKNFDMSPMANAAESVKVKFDAMSVVATTALANITNSAINTGKRIVSALTVAPITTGLSEYELKLNSVQTIVASTGESVDIVNEYLNELNKYSDETIYSFQDMTSNIGKFTNAGVKLEDAVTAIKGISNEAAVSGANAGEASRAMYNFAQALSAGYVKLIDWKSIENANMATVEFKQMLMETAVEVGTLTEAGDGLYNTGKREISATKDFNDSLQDQWMTTDVLVGTLKKYTDRETEIGKKAYDAATKVKTITQMWDILQETAQSGWATTWETILGNLDQAREVFTPLTEFLGGIIDKISDARNDLLNGFLGKSYKELQSRVVQIVTPIEKSAEAIRDVANSAKDYANVVNEILGGKFGSGQERFDNLAEAGYNWAKAQNLVNERLGAATRYDEKLGNEQEALTDETEEATKTTYEYDAAQKQLLSALVAKYKAGKELDGLNDKQKEDIAQIVKLSDDLGMSTSWFIENLDKIDGRWIIIDSFKNLGKGLVNAFTSAAEAWHKVVHGDKTKEEVLQNRADRIFNLTVAFHRFTTRLVTDGEALSNIRDLFSGLASVIDTVVKVTKLGFKIGIGAVDKILGHFNISLLDVLGNLGRGLTAVHDWLDLNSVINNASDKVAETFTNAADKVKQWVDSFIGLDKIRKTSERVAEIIDELKTKISGIFDNQSISIESVADALVTIREAIVSVFDETFSNLFSDVGTNIFDGLFKGLEDGESDLIEKMKSIATRLIDAFKKVLGIASPAKRFIEIAEMIIAGLFKGLEAGAEKVTDFFSDFGEKIKDSVGNIDWGAIFASGLSAAVLVILKKFGDAFNKLTTPIEGAGDVLKKTAGVLGGFKKVLKGFSFELKSKAIKNIALSIGILALSVVALAFVPADKMENAVKALIKLSIVLVAVSFAITKLVKSTSVINRDGKKLNINSVKSGIIGIAASLLLMALAVKMLGNLDQQQTINGFTGLAYMIMALVGVIAAYGLLVKGKAAQNADKFGKLMLKVAVSLLIMAVIIKALGKMDSKQLIVGEGALLAMVGIVALLSLIGSKMGPKQADKIGKMMLMISLSFAAMVRTIKAISKMKVGEFIKGYIGLGMLVLIVSMLTGLAQESGSAMPKVSGMMIALGASFILMSIAIRLLGGMKVSELIKASGVIILFGVIIAGLVAVVTRDGPEAARVAGIILAFSVAIGILAAVVNVLGMMDPEHLKRGVTAVGLLSLFMDGMLLCTKNATGGNPKTIMWLAISIGIMAASIAILSLIDPNKLLSAGSALVATMLSFAIMMKQLPKDKGAILPVIILTAVVAALAGVLIAMSKLNVNNALQNALALSLLVISMSVALKVLSKIGKDQAKGALIGIGLLTLLVIPLAGIALVLSKAGGIQNGVKNAIILTAMTYAMSGLLAILSLIGGKSEGRAILGIGLLTALTIPLLLIVKLLGKMDSVANAERNAIILTGMAAAFTVLLGLLTLIGLAGPAALIGVAALTLMAVPLFLFIKEIGALSKIENGTKNAELLISLMSSIGAVLLLISPFAGKALLATVALGAMMVLMTALGAFALGVGALMDKFPGMEAKVEKGIEFLKNLANGLGAVIGEFVAGFAVSIADSLPQIGMDLSAFMIGVTPFVETVKGVDQSVLDGTKYLAKAIIALTAADLIAGLTNFLGHGSDFASLGTDLSAFIEGARPFIDGIKGIDTASVTAAASLADTVMQLTKAELLDNITGWLTGDPTFDTFGSQLTAFGEAIVAFSDTVSGNIDTEAVDAAAYAGDVMATLQDKVEPTGGVLQGLKGVKDLELFGEQLVAFGESIVAFSATLSEGSVDTTAVEAAKNAGMMMTDLQNSMVGIDGVIGSFTGEKDLAKFGEQIASFGESLVAFSDVAGGGKIDTTAVEAAETAGDMMAKLQDNIDPIDGVIAAFTGDKDLASFGEQIVSFGTALVDFCSIIAGNINTEDVETAKNAGDMMAKLQDAIPENDLFDGKMNLAQFGRKLKIFGEKIADFSEAIADVDTTKITSVITAMTSISDLATDVAEIDTKAFSDVDFTSLATIVGDFTQSAKGIDPVAGVASAKLIQQICNLFSEVSEEKIGEIPSLEELPDIGANLKSYSDAVEDVNMFSLLTSIPSIQKLVDLFSNMGDVDTSKVDQFIDSMESLSNVSFSSMGESMTSASKFSSAGSTAINAMATGMMDSAKSMTNATSTVIRNTAQGAAAQSSLFMNAGKKLMTAFSEGMRFGSSVIPQYAITIASCFSSGIRTRLNSFIDNGKYLCEGLIIGIEQKSQAVYNAAVKLGKLAVKGEKDGQKSKSPSKATIQAGIWLGEGLVIGMDKMGTAVSRSGYEMGQAATDSISSTIEKINDRLYSDFDDQPTIQPILDLTNVKEGVGAINGMFNTQSVGVMANLNGIAASAAYRSQNGPNSDVLSAIGELKNALNGTGGNTYVVNGVTYDDGSNVSTAVADLVHAAKIERRI